jgi:hypothetical protein
LALPPEGQIDDKLSDDELEVALYIYIGQNIREYGILKQDSYLTRKSSIVDSLLKNKIIEERRWYKFNVLRVSYRYMVSLKELLESRLQVEKEGLSFTLKSIPPVLLSFFVFDYLPEGDSFSVKKDWFFDWKNILLENSTINEYRKNFFQILVLKGLCVKAKSYVSTRGGELRESEYVISVEIRNLLAEIIPHMQFPTNLKDLTVVHWLISNQIEYQYRKNVEITILEEELMDFGSELGSIKDEFDALASRLTSEDVVDEIVRLPRIGWELRADKRALKNFIRRDVQNKIVEPLLSEKPKVSKKEIPSEASFLKLVRSLINRKFLVYKVAAQFGGKEIFKSLPSIERCVIDLITPVQGEEGLKKFIHDLHQILEESSRKEVLKFKEGDFVTLEKWLEIEISGEASSFFEDAKSFFKDLNRLRNFYSHSVDAKGIFQTGLIFSKLIGKYSPEQEDIQETQMVLLQRSIRALDNLYRAMEITRQKKFSS